jgi:uncharacterized membrane protein YkoI
MVDGTIRRYLKEVMKRRHPLLSIIILHTLLLCWVFGASGADYDHDRARQLRESGSILPLETILERAKTHRPGRLLEVELDSKHGRIIYEIEIIDKQGVVWEMQYDASSGELLDTERED